VHGEFLRLPAVLKRANAQRAAFLQKYVRGRNAARFGRYGDNRRREALTRRHKPQFLAGRNVSQFESAVGGGNGRRLCHGIARLCRRHLNLDLSQGLARGVVHKTPNGRATLEFREDFVFLAADESLKLCLPHRIAVGANAQDRRQR